MQWYLQYQEDLSPLRDWKIIKKPNSFAPAGASPMQVKLPAQFLQPFSPLCSTQTTETLSEGFEQGGRIGQTEKPWACSVWGCTEICSWSSLCAVDLLNFKPRQDFQFNLLLLKVPTRKTDCGKEEARRDANYVLYSFCLLIKGYTARIKETKLSRSIFLLCSINWMVVPFKRRKGIISSNHYLLSST